MLCCYLRLDLMTFNILVNQLSWDQTMEQILEKKKTKIHGGIYQTLFM